MWSNSGNNGSFNTSSYSNNLSTGGMGGRSPLEDELNTGERLLWSGQPRGGIRLQPFDIFLIPFSLMWGGFAIFWEAMALFMSFGASSPASSAEPGFFRYIFPLWGIPFVLIGLYLMVGRFFVDAKIRSKTWYGITDQRVLIVTDSFGRKVQSLFLQDLPQVELTTQSDGSGTISFGPNSGYPAGLQFTGLQPTGSRRGYTAPAFQMIDNARTVYNILQEAKQRPSGQP